MLNQVTTRPSPRLKDAEIPDTLLSPLYATVLLIVRRLYHCCKLVHADLSEYNILYHNSTLYIIDVSQSVEHDHPSAWDFLRNDLKNVEEFWGKRGAKVLGMRRAFEFVTKEDFFSPENEREEERTVLDRWLDEEPVQGQDNYQSQAQKDTAAHEDQIFMQSYIPRTLNDVYDPERDIATLGRGDGKTLIYGDNIGIVQPMTKEEADGEGGTILLNETEKNQEEGDVRSPDDSEEGEEDDEYEGRKPRGHRQEDREAKKALYYSFFLSTTIDHLATFYRNARNCPKPRHAKNARQKFPKQRKSAKSRFPRGSLDICCGCHLVRRVQV